jgi:branched-chain amino acid transport system ATP-binding protein
LTRQGLVQIPEGRLVIKELSVEDNLRLGAYPHYFKISTSELRNDMENVHRLFPRLRERKDQIAGTLSGGEQQMLAIGRGLMARPKLLMLDEPSLGLAPMLVESMFQVIETLNEEGLPILLVEQNVKAALSIAHRAYILETGSVVTEGRASDLANDQNVISAYLGC